MNWIESFKNPVVRHKLAVALDHPAGSTLEEIDEHDTYVHELNAGAASLSARLGNRGYVCTLTKECQWICQATSATTIK